MSTYKWKFQSLFVSSYRLRKSLSHSSTRPDLLCFDDHSKDKQSLGIYRFIEKFVFHCLRSQADTQANLSLLIKPGSHWLIDQYMSAGQTDWGMVQHTPTADDVQMTSHQTAVATATTSAKVIPTVMPRAPLTFSTDFRPLHHWNHGLLKLL